jgi:hypothetical protein
LEATTALERATASLVERRLRLEALALERAVIVLLEDATTLLKAAASPLLIA